MSQGSYVFDVSVGGQGSVKLMSHGIYFFFCNVDDVIYVVVLEISSLIGYGTSLCGKKWNGKMSSVSLIGDVFQSDETFFVGTRISALNVNPNDFWSFESCDYWKLQFSFWNA